MFRNDDELQPKTYSIKGYRIKRRINYMRLVKVSLISLILIFIAGIMLMSYENLI